MGDPGHDGKRSGNGLNILLMKSTEDGLKASPPFSTLFLKPSPAAFVCVHVFARGKFTLSPKRQKKANSIFHKLNLSFRAALVDVCTRGI